VQYVPVACLKHCVMYASVLQPAYSQDQQWSIKFAQNFDDSNDSGDDQGTDVRSGQTVMVRQYILCIR